MMKKYMNLSFIYAILAMVGGVFYREFTKALSFSGKTTLSVIHTHYFLLGMVFFLILLLLEKAFSFSTKKTEKLIIVYNVGLNILAFALLVRGIAQALEMQLSAGMDASISGVAGIGHILTGVSMLMILYQAKKTIQK